MITDTDLSPLRRSSAGSVRPEFANALVQNLFGGHTAVLNRSALNLVRQAGVPAGIVYHDWWLYQLVSGAGGRLVLDAARRRCIASTMPISWAAPAALGRRCGGWRCWRAATGAAPFWRMPGPCNPCSNC